LAELTAEDTIAFLRLGIEQNTQIIAAHKGASLQMPSFFLAGMALLVTFIQVLIQLASKPAWAAYDFALMGFTFLVCVVVMGLFYLAYAQTKEASEWYGGILAQNSEYFSLIDYLMRKKAGAAKP